MKTFTTIKRSALLSSLLIAGTIPSIQAVDYIEQVDLETGLVYQIYVTTGDGTISGDGTIISPMPVGNDGSTYQLYAEGLPPDSTMYLLDEKYVASYTPEAHIVISSEDPHPTPRTRADEPFTIDIEVKGLLAPGEDVPEAALNVYFQELTMNYDPVLDRATDPDPANETLENDFFIVENSEVQRTGMTRLDSNVFFKERGEEIFRAYALPDADLDWLQIASEKIQVWPIADVAITGMEPDQQITRSLPDLNISLTDLYPDSTTIVQVYKGSQALGTQGVEVEGSRVSFNSIVPQDAQIVLRHWDKYAPDDGDYTVEVITVTPFNNRQPERLVWLSFSVDRTIEMNGSSTTSE
ncbi:MAG: hypothetical protein KJO21_08010 [Verrucomicrobiae bacterium]|nr:hypothetical protein [Verrucomicrobiae bacterium]NNJ43418.1 hypothetical protein [Akkermansiaceae bacterium]